MNKIKKLQMLIQSAAWLCSIRCPNGVDKSVWDKSINDLFKANQLIMGMNKDR